MAGPIKALQERKKKLVAEGDKLLASARTPANEARFKAVENELAEVNTALNRAMALTEQALEVAGTDPRRGPFASLGDQLQAVARAGIEGGGAPDPRLFAAAGASESVASDGGFLVQTEYARDLLARGFTESILGSRVRRLPSSRAGLKVPVAAESSRKSGSRLGGVSLSWVPEGGTIPASQPEIREVGLTNKKLAGLCYVTNELLEDSAGALELFLRDAFAEEFGFVIDDAILRGSGVGEPLGVLNAPALVTVPAAANQAAGTIVGQNVLDMWARMPARNRRRAIWIVGEDSEALLPSLSLSDGASYIPASGLYTPPARFDGASGTLLGRPVFTLEQASAPGAVGDIVLMDPLSYLWTDRGLRSDVSLYAKFLEDESAFRFTLRCDGAPTWDRPIEPVNGTDDRSAFVTLAARA